MLEEQLVENFYDVNLLKRLAIVLLITAIPFHADDKNRQEAFWLRGIELIEALKDGDK